MSPSPPRRRSQRFRPRKKKNVKNVNDARMLTADPPVKRTAKTPPENGCTRKTIRLICAVDEVRSTVEWWGCGSSLKYGRSSKKKHLNLFCYIYMYVYSLLMLVVTSFWLLLWKVIWHVSVHQYLHSNLSHQWNINCDYHGWIDLLLIGHNEASFQNKSY